jgi:hypothetical protein
VRCHWEKNVDCLNNEEYAREQENNLLTTKTLLEACMATTLCSLASGNDNLLHYDNF